MTKADRAKMADRFSTLKIVGDVGHRGNCTIFNWAVSEVNRAVRAKSKAQRDTEELWASHRRRAEEQIVERAKGLGMKRT